MLLKLRQDYKQQQGKAFSLRSFHDTLLGKRHGAVLAPSPADARPTTAATCLNKTRNLTDAVFTNTNATRAITASS